MTKMADFDLLKWPNLIPHIKSKCRKVKLQISPPRTVHIANFGLGLQLNPEQMRPFHFLCVTFFNVIVELTLVFQNSSKNVGKLLTPYKSNQVPFPPLRFDPPRPCPSGPKKKMRLTSRDVSQYAKVLCLVRTKNQCSTALFMVLGNPTLTGFLMNRTLPEIDRDQRMNDEMNK